MRSLGRRSLILSVVIGLLGGMLPAPAAAAAPTLSFATIASGLSIPWDVAFVPDGTMLVTERPGRVRVYASGGTNLTPIRTITIPSVRQWGEGGLMGIAVDVDYATNRYVYVCATREYGGTTKNEVLRYTISGNGSWTNQAILLGGMTANNIHNGCALEMDKHAKLWISMGDANNNSLAQNRSSLNGKILRINRDGSIPSDNPVINSTKDAVYSMGHRNPQGIAFQPGTDRVYAVEHGPARDDEINLIVSGGNYGWPCFTGAATPGPNSTDCLPAANYLAPVWASGFPTIATSGGAFAWGSQWADWDGHLFVSNLKDKDVHRFTPNASGTVMTMGPAIVEGSDRFRAMVSGPGGQLYITTSNSSSPNTDRVIRISPAASSVGRIAGADRYATAAAVSASGYPGGATSVMVATGTDFPDALAGSAAAGHEGMPVLLVTRDSIPAATATELNRLDPQRIFVLGGTGVVSEAVRVALQSYASTGEAKRLAGANRYATAAAISSEFHSPGVGAVFVATSHAFADALAGAPAAAMLDAPLLLVARTSIPAATADELDRLNPGKIYVLGGTSAINATVASELADYAPVTRLAGANRFATAAAITSAFWTRTDGYVASGRGFADALTGGAIAGMRHQPMLLTDFGNVPLVIGQEVLQFGSRQLTVLGGTAAVPTSAENVLKRLVGTP